MAKKILVVDDDPPLVELIANRLAAHRYEVLKAVSGHEGLEKAGREKPDLILLDIMMPDMDGFQVLRCLKEATETKNVPVMMLTVRRWSEDMERAMTAGAVGYIVKPFEASALMEKIKEALKDG